MNHTPTPWQSDWTAKYENSWKCQIIPSNGHPAVAYSWGLDREIAEANAAFIVRAVNAHNELLDFVKDYHWTLISRSGHLEKDCNCSIAKAIAKAEGKS